MVVIKAQDFMNRKLITVKPKTCLVKAGKLMAKHKIGGVPVVRNKKLIGILTERDIINGVIAKGKNPKEIKSSDIMTSPVRVTGSIGDDLESVAKKMTENDVSRIPIMDGEKIIGLITNKDIAREAPQLVSVLLEKIKMHEGALKEPVSFGKCDVCGEFGNLVFENSHFVCDLCSKKVK